MPLETVNLTLFSWINATPHAPTQAIHIATFIAQDLLYILAFLLIFLWCQGNKAMKERALKAVFMTTIGLVISFIISSIFYHPRPFAMPIGQNYLAHTANGSFPSDHMLIFSTIAFSYLFSNRKMTGLILLCCAWLVAWSRIYLGVHFPFDMLGAFILAFLLNWVGFYIWQRYGQLIFKPLLHLYHQLFGYFIAKGFIR